MWMFSNAEAIYLLSFPIFVCENSVERCLVVVVTLLPKRSVYVYEWDVCARECCVYVSRYVRTASICAIIRMWCKCARVHFSLHRWPFPCMRFDVSTMFFVYSLCIFGEYIETSLSSFACVRSLHWHIGIGWACICQICFHSTRIQTYDAISACKMLSLYAYQFKCCLYLNPSAERDRRFSTISTIRRCSAMHKILQMYCFHSIFAESYSNQKKTQIHMHLSSCSRIPPVYVRVKLSFEFVRIAITHNERHIHNSSCHCRCGLVPQTIVLDFVNIVNCNRISMQGSQYYDNQTREKKNDWKIYNDNFKCNAQ